MHNRFTQASTLLEENGCTLVLCYRDTVIMDHRRGIRPLLELLQENRCWHGFIAADKVVGKAAAFLYRCMGISGVYARVISQPAAQVLHAGGILLEYETMVPAIRNRDNTGFCPMETAVLHTEDPSEAWHILQTRMTEK